MDPSYPVLSRSESRLLFRLFRARPNDCVFESRPDGLTRLLNLDFVSFYHVDEVGHRAFGTKFIAVHIEEPGINYCLMKRQSNRKELSAWIRYIITTVIAIFALLIAAISLAAQLDLLQLPTP